VPARESASLETLRTTTATATGTAKKKNNGFNGQNNNFARASRFFAHFFAVSAQQQREMTKF